MEPHIARDWFADPDCDVEVTLRRRETLAGQCLRNPHLLFGRDVGLLGALRLGGLAGRTSGRVLRIVRRLRARGVGRRRRSVGVLALLGGILCAFTLIAARFLLRRGRSLALPLSRGSILRFFLLGAGLAAGRVIAIHLGATLGAVLVLAFASSLRVTATLAGILCSLAGFCVLAASALVIACGRRTLARWRGLALFVSLSGTRSSFFAAGCALRLLFLALRAFLHPLGAPFLRCSTLAGLAWSRLLLFVASPGRSLAI